MKEVQAESEVLFAKLKPECMLWEFKEEYLLPGSIDLTAFQANPGSCLPLKSMFELAGYSQIKKVIDDESERPNGLRNLLNRVAAVATEHMQGIWKDYRGIGIELTS